MRELISRYLNDGMSRRSLFRNLARLGLTTAASQALMAQVEVSEKAARNEAVPDSYTAEGTGGALLVEQMRAAGVEYLFTNPGSFEVGFFDAFIDQPGMHLIMGLHEGIVVSMADGYARVSGKPGFINVHVVAGTAQMAGQLYNASRDGTPLVITAGLNDNEVWSDESVLAPRPGHNQKDIASQFTKISWEARQAASLPLMLRRAFKTATAAPGGPVYLAMAHYALEARNAKAQILPARRFLLNNRIRPSASAVQEAAKMIVEARRPLLVIGDEVWKSGAQQELLALAEEFGLAVADQTNRFRNFPVRPPNYLGMFQASSAFVTPVDLIVSVGARDFGGRVVPSAPEAPPDAKIVRIGLDTASMGRNYPTDLALVGDVKEALTDLRAALAATVTAQRRRAIALSREGQFRTGIESARKRADAAARANFGKGPIHPDEVGAVLARTMDRNGILVSENLTGKHDAFNFGFREDEQMWLGNTGAGLGWGIGAAIGAKLASPDRQVVCSIGDGSVMYSASGFWSQVRYNIPVLTVVWNNKNYQTVRHAYAGYKGRMTQQGHYAGMYLGDPDIDFVQLAASQGVGGEKASSGASLEAALKRGMAANRDGKPYLVEADVARYGGGAESTWHGSFHLAAAKKAKA